MSLSYKMIQYFLQLEENTGFAHYNVSHGFPVSHEFRYLVRLFTKSHHLTQPVVEKQRIVPKLSIMEFWLLLRADLELYPDHYDPSVEAHLEIVVADLWHELQEAISIGGREVE